MNQHRVSHRRALGPPDVGLDLRDPIAAVGLFEQAAEINLRTKSREGGMVRLAGRGRLLMSGDLHDNGPNLQRILKLAHLDRDDSHHLVLHEVIHGPHRVNGRDHSIRTLARVAALKLAYPDQVHVLQSNHELAQICGDEITKDGVGVIDAFDAGVNFMYGEEAPGVRTAMARFIRSLPLAVQCPNRIMCSHSLPSPRMLETFDTTVLQRVAREQDLMSGGSAHMMVWGRNHNQELADALGRAWGVELFVLGHQPVEMGYETEGQSILIMASDHDHGQALPIDLATEYDLNGLIGQMVPLGAVVL